MDALISFLAFIIDFIRIDIFIVFGIYSLAFIVTSLILKDKSRLDKIDELSSRFIRFMGLVYITCFLFFIITSLISGIETRNRLLLNMFGPYWFALLLPPITNLVITQLLRFEKIRKSMIIRLIFVPFLLFTFEQIVILITSLHRDYMPSSWFIVTNINLSAFEIIFGFLTKIVLYSFYIGLFYFLTEQLKKIRFTLNKTK